MWLEAFPRTLLSFDFYFLSAIRQTVNKPPYDPQAHENFRQAQAIQDFLQYVPLENISLHSASPAPTGPIEQGHHRTPLDLLAAAAEFQTITETKPDVVLTNSARNLVHLYHLDERLLDHAVSHHEHSRKNVGPRKTLEGFSAHIRSLFGVAPRAAREQERLPSRSEPRSRSAAIRSMRQRRSSSSDAHRRRRSPVKRPSPTKPRANREPSPQRDSRSKLPHSGERDPRSRLPHSGGRNHHQTKDTYRSLSRNRSPRKQPTHFMVNIDQNPQQTVRYVPPLYVLPNTDATREKKPIRLCDLKLPPPNQLSFSSRLEGRVARGGQALQDLPEPWQLYSGSRLEGRIAERGQPLPVPTVRQKIQALKSLQQSMPQPSVLQQLQDLRQQSPQRPTHSVGNVPPMRQPAHSAESEPPASQSEVTTRAHAPDPRLYKKEPVFTMEMFPQDLSSDEVYHEVNQLLEREEEDEGMRPLLSENLASVTLVPAQPEVFQVPRQPGPEPNPFDPFHECDGDGEDRTVFHLSLKIVEYVSNRHWKNQRGIRGSGEYQELLKKVRRLKVRSLAQMTLLKYISRLRGNDEVRTPLALKLLHQVLTAQDLSHSLPRILLECHANLTDDDTNDPWPTCKDFRHAVEHWSCYCSHAAVYIFEHLSVPDALVFPNVHDRGDAINDVRHQVYVQYGYDHIMAVLRGVPDIDWLRFDASKKTKFPLGLPLMAPTIVFVDRYIWDTFGKDLRADVEMILIQNSTRDEIIGELRKYFPHSSTTRVILWMGPDYFTEGNKGYMFILASFCHHYSTYFGHVEQYVVLPTYIRSKRMRWGYSVLSSYIQRRELLPYARVAIDPLAVRLWERDERLSSVQGRLPKWFDCGLDENGHYTSDGLIYATRGYLTLYHDLDLWKDMDKPSNDDDDALSIATVEAMQTTEPSTSDTCHTSRCGGHRSVHCQQRLFREGASASSAEELSKCALKIAMDLAMQEHAPRLQNVAQKLDKTQRPSKTSDSQKDSDHDPRKDQDREPRK
ncbi:hypothetical protein AAVH_36777 [Aphelenchoides avenae]|nr:hypothetical protein AAVH_36777 [Aphelenchus avenae]